MRAIRLHDRQKQAVPVHAGAAFALERAMADAALAAARKIDLRWTERRRKTFIGVLAETYDDGAALEASGLSWPDVRELRVRHPDFAERIEEVIAAGYDRLEAALLRAAGVGGAAINPALAQALLKQRRTGKADAAIAQRRAKGPTPTQAQLLRSPRDRMAPLRAASRGGVSHGRGDAAGSDTDRPGGTELRA